MTTFIDRIVGNVGDKRRWWDYRARVKALPPHYGTAVGALERYLSHLAAITTGGLPADVLMTMLDDLTGLFEQAAMNGTPPIHAVIGADPVEFADSFLRSHTGAQWVGRARDSRLSAIEREFHKEIDREIGRDRKRLAQILGRADAAGARARSAAS